MNLLKKALDYMERIIAIKKQLGVLFKHGKDELLTEYDIDVIDDGLSTLFQTNFFRLFFRYCTGV